jgi:hypothetical protein
MRGLLCLLSVLCAASAVVPVLSAAQEPQRPLVQPPELIYGAELMSHPERRRYRARWRGAATPEARERIRREHRAQMQERARKHGLSIGESGVVEPASTTSPPAK